MPLRKARLGGEVRPASLRFRDDLARNAGNSWCGRWCPSSYKLMDIGELQFHYGFWYLYVFITIVAGAYKNPIYGGAPSSDVSLLVYNPMNASSIYLP